MIAVINKYLRCLLKTFICQVMLVGAFLKSVQGATYEFVDTDVQNRKTYYYKLEDVALNGTSAMHGHVNATPRLLLGVRD
jgi:hypothetical protein